MGEEMAAWRNAWAAATEALVCGAEERCWKPGTYAGAETPGRGTVPEFTVVIGVIAFIPFPCKGAALEGAALVVVVARAFRANARSFKAALILRWMRAASAGRTSFFKTGAPGTGGAAGRDPRSIPATAAGGAIGRGPCPIPPGVEIGREEIAARRDGPPTTAGGRTTTPLAPTRTPC